MHHIKEVQAHALRRRTQAEDPGAGAGEAAKAIRAEGPHQIARRRGDGQGRPDPRRLLRPLQSRRTTWWPPPSARCSRRAARGWRRETEGAIAGRGPAAATSTSICPASIATRAAAAARCPSWSADAPRLTGQRAGALRGGRRAACAGRSAGAAGASSAHADPRPTASSMLAEMVGRPVAGPRRARSRARPTPSSSARAPSLKQPLRPGDPPMSLVALTEPPAAPAWSSCAPDAR